MLVSADRTRPENLHEVTGFGLIDVVEIWTQPQLVKQTRSAGPICIPPTPDALSIVLVADDQALQRAVVKTKLATLPQSFDRSDENEICRARTETRPRRNNKEFAGLKMCRRLEANLRKMGN